MKIIAGTHRGRPLKSPRHKELRPTTGRFRESIFSALVHRLGGSLEGLRVADVFAGSGAFGLEALSRGAAEAVFVEKSPEALALLEENLKTLAMTERGRIVRADASRLPREQPFDVIFLDPPYGRALHQAALASLVDQGWIVPNTLVLVEREQRDPANWLPAHEVRCLRQGRRCVHFLYFNGQPHPTMKISDQNKGAEIKTEEPVKKKRREKKINPSYSQKTKVVE